MYKKIYMYSNNYTNNTSSSFTKYRIVPAHTYVLSEMITPRSISREVNESIPPSNATLEIVLKKDVIDPPTLLIRH